MEFFILNKTQRKWYDDKDCPLVYVPVPKGGMVLWDSRTVHDTDPPAIDTLSGLERTSVTSFEYLYMLFA
jgi:hypothetical protein